MNTAPYPPLFLSEVEPRRRLALLEQRLRVARSMLSPVDPLVAALERSIDQTQGELQGVEQGKTVE